MEDAFFPAAIILRVLSHEHDASTARAFNQVEVYKAVRAHELMLNEAASAFEHAVIAPLVVLNGGAVVAFLTLVGAIKDPEPGLGPDGSWVAAATMIWAAGLVAAALAA